MAASCPRAHFGGRGKVARLGIDTRTRRRRKESRVENERTVEDRVHHRPAWKFRFRPARGEYRDEPGYPADAAADERSFPRRIVRGRSGQSSYVRPARRRQKHTRCRRAS